MRSKVLHVSNTDKPVSPEPEQVPVHDDERVVAVGERDLDGRLQDGVVDDARVLDAVAAARIVRRSVARGTVQASEMRPGSPRLPKCQCHVTG